MVLVSKTKRPSSIHHKRRHGRHHKKSNDYSKPYWPYLPLGIIVGLGLLVNGFWGVVQQTILGYATNMSVSSLVSDTNSQRSSGGLQALAANSKLNQAAQAKANDMAARNYWSHNTPEGNPPWVFFASAGYDYTAAGENLAYGFDDSSATITAWMNSPGHRANILNGEFAEVGFGIANVENYQDTGPQTVVVAMYGTPKVAAASAPAPAAPAKNSQPAPKPAPVAEQAPPAEEPAPSEPTPTPDIVVADSSEMAPASQTVARIQLLTAAAAPWTILVVTIMATVAIAIVFLRHSLVWHRALLRGERFILKHKFLDVALVLLGVVGFVLTRTAGSIH
ncbi:MAG: CAP domain-containing protein [Candidatus Saccharimonadales bacterium]